MAKIVRMSDFAGTREPERKAREADLKLRMSDILGRDYARLEDVVHGILRIRDILEHAVGPDSEWHVLLLDLLREACWSNRFCRAGHPGLRRRYRQSGIERGRGLRLLAPSAARRIQEYIEGRLESGNALELGSAVVILKLMEHTPEARALLR